LGEPLKETHQDAIWKFEILCVKQVWLLKAAIQGLFWLCRLSIYSLPAKPEKLWLVVVCDRRRSGSLSGAHCVW